MTVQQPRRNTSRNHPISMFQLFGQISSRPAAFGCVGATWSNMGYRFACWAAIIPCFSRKMHILDVGGQVALLTQKWTLFLAVRLMPQKDSSGLRPRLRDAWEKEKSIQAKCISMVWLGVAWASLDHINMCKYYAYRYRHTHTRTCKIENSGCVHDLDVLGGYLCFMLFLNLAASPFVVPIARVLMAVDPAPA